MDLTAILAALGCSPELASLLAPLMPVLLPVLIYLLVVAIPGTAAPLAALLGHPAPDSPLMPLRQALDRAAFNVGNAANAATSPAPAAAPLTRVLPLILLLGLAACAVTPADRAQQAAVAQTVDQVLLIAADAYLAAHPVTAPEAAKIAEAKAGLQAAIAAWGSAPGDASMAGLTAAVAGMQAALAAAQAPLVVAPAG